MNVKPQISAALAMAWIGDFILDQSAGTMPAF
jgi:hypothetical protein